MIEHQLALEEDAPAPDRTPPALRSLLIAACPFPCRRGTPARPFAQLRALARAGVDAHIATYHLRDFEAPPDFRVHRIPRVPWYRRTRAGPTVQKLLLLNPLLLRTTLAVARRTRPHVLHGHHVEGGLIALAAGRRLGIPVVFDAHTSLLDELPSHLSWLSGDWIHQLGGRIDGFVAQHSTHTVVVSEALRDVLLERVAGLAPGRVTVVPTPLEPADLPAQAFAREPGASSAPTLVYAGGAAPFQRLDLLHKVFERVLGAVPEARLLLVTNDRGPDLERCFPGVSSHPSVDVVTPANLSEVFDCLARGHVAVSPRTATGGLPQKVLNYMAAGLPTVACTGSSPSLQHGQTGWVVDDHDDEAFASAVVALIHNPALRDRLGRAARRAARQGFCHPSAGERLREIYSAVLGLERGRGGRSRRESASS